MQPLRAFCGRHFCLAWLIVLAALFLRLVIPTGFMPAMEHGRLIVVPCPGFGPVSAAPSAATSGSSAAASDAHSMHAGMAHHAAPEAAAESHHEGGSPHAQDSCSFADLSLTAIGGADPVQLAAALLFIIAMALFTVTAARPQRALRLRPPLRGPPLFA